MIFFKILGVGTAEHEYLKSMIVDWMRKENIPFAVDDVKEIDDFIQSGITSIPAVVINDHVKFQRKDFNDLRSFAHAIFDYVDRFKKLHMKKIIVPTDFSENAGNAGQYAIKLSQYFNCEVTLLHIFHPAVDINTGYFLDPEIETKKRNMLTEQVKELNQSMQGEVVTSAKINSQFAMGFPIEEIVRLSEEAECMIVMGATGETGMFGKVFGSISSAVARMAHCPVLLVPSGKSFRPYEQIMYASNESRFDEKIALIIKQFVSTFDAKLHCIHVDKGADYYPDWEMKGLFGQNGYDVHLVEANIPETNIAKGLNQYASDKEIDLLIMGTRHRNFWENLVHTSVTKKMALHPQLPLLVFHAGDKL
ncbi:MAG: universal stress protein [Saprospiraceae bacterium]|nr:universal stress protein [Saprospiraceae bacterium]